MEEIRYEAITLIVKSRADGKPWFEIFEEMIAGDCEGGGGDCIMEPGEDSDCADHDHEEIIQCTCGLESMGGMSGTLDQCYRWTMPDISDEEWERDWK